MASMYSGKEKCMATPTVETNVEARKPYTRPQLTCYGNITELTQFLTGNSIDGFGGSVQS
jgi:hypothetical protein